MSTVTEHHPSPIVYDPQVHQAIALLRQTQLLINRAMSALEHGDKYNGQELGVNDHFPNGVHDYVTRLLEPFLRTYTLSQNGHDREDLTEQARDCVGYAALFSAWFVTGLPESVLARTIHHLYPQRCKCQDGQNKNEQN